MHITRLNSFDEVAAWYEKTPVLKSKRHTVEQDIRPIGKRSRKYERIIKISKNCYALSCGGNVDPVFHWGWEEYIAKHPITPKETARLSPIVWRKLADGTETVTIRNGQGDWQHNAVYSFISRALPQGLSFSINRQGRQAIYSRADSKEYHLPKTKTLPRHVYEQRKEQATKAVYYRERLVNCQVHFDNLSLTFKRNKNGAFELLGEAPKEMIIRKRVDVAEKTKFKPMFDDVYAWATTMYPLMREQLTYSFRNDIGKRLREIAEEKKTPGYRQSWGELFAYSEPKLIRAILADPQHPMRYEFGVAAMFVIDGELKYRAADELSDVELRAKVRAAYVRWINKLAGFTNTVKEEK